jgi:hypothetical protein
MGVEVVSRGRGFAVGILVSSAGSSWMMKSRSSLVFVLREGTRMRGSRCMLSVCKEAVVGWVALPVDALECMWVWRRAELGMQPLNVAR